MADATWKQTERAVANFSPLVEAHGFKREKRMKGKIFVGIGQRHKQSGRRWRFASASVSLRCINFM